MRSEPYRRLVAAMPCARCGSSRPSDDGQGISQHCHMDLGKGMAIKTDDRYGWPGCPKCHDFVSREMERDLRRMVEAQMVLDTIRAITVAGTWPARVPRLTDDEMATLRHWAGHEE